PLVSPSTSFTSFFYLFNCPPLPIATLFPYTTLFRSRRHLSLISPRDAIWKLHWPEAGESFEDLQTSRTPAHIRLIFEELFFIELDRKSTRLNSSHEWISYAVFCLKKKKERNIALPRS